MVDQSEKLVELAIENQFLSKDSADKLIGESLKLSMPIEALALKTGLLAPWQLEALRALVNPERLIPGYRLKSLLGRGGFGSVFRATQVNMERDVALKTIPLSAVKNSSAARRFEREAKIVGQLRHPHIVAAYDFGFHEERLFLTLELVEGKDLGNLIRRVKKFDEFTALHVIRQTVTALAYAAEKGITHRDIKPGNLLVTNTPIGYSLPKYVPFVKVADFGLACFNETRREEGITLENSGIGTPSYVAPEQLQGRDDVDIRADIYSLGATAFRLITGVAPYEALPPMAVAKEKLSGNEAWLNQMDSFSPGARGLINKMSAFDVEHRFDDHKELLVAIDDVIDSLGTRLKKETQVFSLQQAGEILQEASTTEASFLCVDEETKDSGSHDSDFELNVPKDALVSKIVRKRALKWPLISFAVSGVLIVLSVVYFWILRSDGQQQIVASNFEPDYSTTVRSFDGLKLDYSKFKVRRGTWAIGQDDDGGRILTGRNCNVIFPCKDNSRAAFGLFRFSVGVGLEEDLAVVIKVTEVETGEALFGVALDSEGAKVFGESNGRRKSFAPNSKWPNDIDDSHGYYELAIERLPNSWQVRRDSVTIGQIKNTSQVPVEIAIEVDGVARFESPQFCAIVEKKSDAHELQN